MKREKIFCEREEWYCIRWSQSLSSELKTCYSLMVLCTNFIVFTWGHRIGAPLVHYQCVSSFFPKCFKPLLYFLIRQKFQLYWLLVTQINIESFGSKFPQNLQQDKLVKVPLTPTHTVSQWPSPFLTDVRNTFSILLLHLISIYWEYATRLIYLFLG